MNEAGPKWLRTAPWYDLYKEMKLCNRKWIGALEGLGMGGGFFYKEAPGSSEHKRTVLYIDFGSGHSSVNIQNCTTEGSF